MEYVFTCSCKCLFARYVKNDEPIVATCPLCSAQVESNLPMREARTGKSHTVISDIAEFQSPVDRTSVGSRSTLREHNKRNDVVQIGNDNVTPQEHAPMSRAGHDVKRALDAARN